MFLVTIGLRFFIDLAHDGVQPFLTAGHDQVAHQGFQGRTVVVFGDSRALGRQGIGIAGPLTDSLLFVRQAVVDAAVDIGLGLGGYKFRRQRVQDLDVGDARIGVAVSDASRLIATPVEVIHRVGFGPDVKRVQEICRRYDTTLILSGLPLNLNGTEGPQAAKVRLFCQQLEKVGLVVYYQDERLTTVTAENALLEQNMHRAQRRQTVDKVAAAVILQQYLDTINQQP